MLLLLSKKNITQFKEIKIRKRNIIDEKRDLLKNDWIIIYQRCYFL